MRHIARTALIAPALAPALAAALALGGCENPDGRIDPARTTKSERADDRILPVALLEFSDAAAMKLVQELQYVPEVRDIDGPVTIILGDIENKTLYVSTTDFEFMVDRLRNNLLNSAAHGKLQFVENRARMERLVARERVGTPGEDPAQPANYDAKTTFFLNADVYQVERGSTNLYGIFGQLVSPTTNRIVWQKELDVKQSSDG